MVDKKTEVEIDKLLDGESFEMPKYAMPVLEGLWLDVKDLKLTDEREETGTIDDGFLDSIQANGVLVPLLIGSDNQIIDGRRRYRAAQKLNMQKLPVALVTKGESLLLSVLTNQQRRSMSDVEKAKRYQKILDANKWQQKQLAKILGISTSSVAECLNLLALPKSTQNDITSGKTTARSQRSKASKAAQAKKTPEEKPKATGRKKTQVWVPTDSLPDNVLSCKIEEKSATYTVQLPIDRKLTAARVVAPVQKASKVLAKLIKAYRADLD